ncbi:GNAT family N-acetyltransferase [Nocardioides sp. Root140]|uniref:GNAT family N-acetyltransferase n=1 Tax=Nocardioides sp. Root140 TaxID=1736460 RepID=UPI0006FD837F|nr:GNAT family N-acetyltransferase [Nocardioides sp. Root140]KQY50165.1 acyltransferase [Nocardioides sp. Root140]
MELTWLGSHHDDLTARQMHDLLRLRHRVFVIEQDCPDYEDIDGLDVVEGTHHVLGSDGDRLLAYARVVAPGAQSPQARIGRVVVSGEARGTGVGHALMRETLALCERVWPGQELMLAAQAHLADYYGRYGFAPVGEVYVEDGIDHLNMVRPS